MVVATRSGRTYRTEVGSVQWTITRSAVPKTAGPNAELAENASRPDPSGQAATTYNPVKSRTKQRICPKKVPVGKQLVIDRNPHLIGGPFPEFARVTESL